MDTDLIRKAAKAIPNGYEDLPFALEQLADDADEIEARCRPVPVSARLPKYDGLYLLFISGSEYFDTGWYMGVCETEGRVAPRWTASDFSKLEAEVFPSYWMEIPLNPE